MKYFIVICGDLAAGKSTYGKKVSKELQIPFFSKDKIKEILFDSMNNRNLSYEEKRKIGASSYAVFYNIAEQLMEANQAFILESNFIKESEDILKTFISKYDYKCITIKFIGDLKVLHERFKQREYSEERHQSLVANGKFDSFEEYREAFGERELYPFMLDAEMKLYEIRPKRVFSLIFGNEATGLPDEFSCIGTSVVIPHSGRIDSLNLPIAASIAMYEATKPKI